MQFRAVFFSPEDKRREYSSICIETSCVRALCSAFALAATAIDDKCSGAIARHFFDLPKGKDEREHLLSLVINEQAEPLPVKPPPYSDAWFEVCEQVCTIGPGMHCLFTTVLAKDGPVIWTPGDALDITLSVSRLTSSLEKSGLHPAQGIGGVMSQLSAFLHVARGNQSYVVVEKDATDC